MSSDVGEIKAAALALSEPDRADLIARLMESLEGPPDADVERAWGERDRMPAGGLVAYAEEGSRFRRSQRKDCWRRKCGTGRNRCRFRSMG